MSGPSPNGVPDRVGGRDAAGRFANGWRGGPGNPHAAQVARLRSALLKCVTVQDLADVIRALIDRAKSGDVQAVRELLDRTIGRAADVPPDLLARLDDLEGRLDPRGRVEGPR